MNRVGFIGGSDCVKIMQGNWLDLWKIKTGREQPADLSRNLAVQMGIHTEDFNLAWFEAERNVTVSGQQTEFKADVGGIPVVGTVDGMLDRNIVECKHTNSFNKMSNVIEYYMPQLQTLHAHRRCRWCLPISNLWQQRMGQCACRKGRELLQFYVGSGIRLLGLRSAGRRTNRYRHTSSRHEYYSSGQNGHARRVTR